MQRRISSDGATALAKIFAGVPFSLVSLMLAASVHNGRIGVWVAVAGLALLGAYFWAVRRFVWNAIDGVRNIAADLRHRVRIATSAAL